MTHAARSPRPALLSGTVAFLACLPAGRAFGHAPLPTVPFVDLSRFAGTWHEIARLPNMFQRSCVRSRASYTLCSDGTLSVVNTCTTTRGRCRRAEGHAEVVPCSGNARLRVRFSGLAAVVPVPRDGNYWIIALDDDYQWAVVGTPDRRFLWILARDPHLPEGLVRDLAARVCHLGFDVDRLVR